MRREVGSDCARENDTRSWMNVCESHCPGKNNTLKAEIESANCVRTLYR